MGIALNHTIVAARDPEMSAAWLADLFGLPAPERLGHFWQVTTGNGVGLDFDRHSGDGPIAAQHYAFLIGEDDFDAIFGRIVERDIDHYADPMGRRRGEINQHDGGRGVYFPSPDGHWLEIITVPYGGWADTTAG
ncbi:MAG: VOC family protein [Ilumatobacteraceae bacterium]